MTFPTIITRLSLAFPLLQFCLTSTAQTKISGQYLISKNSTENYLNLLEDLTFTYSWRGHMWADKSNGLYKTNGDTIYLTFRPFRGDTSYADEKPIILYTEALYAINRPDTLFYKKNKLYRIENGKIINKTERNRVNFIKTKGWRKHYRKQYYIFGPYISKKRKTHYLQKF